MKASEYVYIRAWARVAGMPEVWLLAEQAKAERDRAPADAIYRTHLGRWARVGDLAPLDARDVIERYVAGVDAVSASEAE